MPIGNRPLPRYLAGSDLLQYELKQLKVRVGDADNKASVLVRVQTGQSNRAFPVNQACQVSSDVQRQVAGLL